MLIDCFEWLRVAGFSPSFSSFSRMLKSPKAPISGFPAQTGIQAWQGFLDPGFRRGDAENMFSNIFLRCPQKT